MTKAKYVDGFVLPVPKKNLKAYLKIAAKAGKIWKEYGALDYNEAVGDDMNIPMGIPLPKMVKTKSDETIVFAWITYKSKAHRNQVNAKVMKDPRLCAGIDINNMPFDCKRMSWGGFQIKVNP